MFGLALLALLICDVGGPGSTTQAQPVVDEFLRRIAAVGDWKEGELSGAYHTEADAIGRIRQRASWSNYVTELIANVQQAVPEYSGISNLRFLLYPSGLRPEDRARIERDDAGVAWLE